MNKLLVFFVIGIVGLISILFTLSFFGFFYDPSDYCGQYLTFHYAEQDYVDPTKEIKLYLSAKLGDKINVEKIDGYGVSTPNAQVPKPTIWHIQLQDRWMKTPIDIEIIKSSLQNNPKISNLEGPFSICENLSETLGEFVPVFVTVSIPSWIEQHTVWWSKNLIDDYSFVTGIQELIKLGIIGSPVAYDASPYEKIVPDWFRNNAKWWADGKISDFDLVFGIDYLVENKIIDVREKEIKTLE